MKKLYKKRIVLVVAICAFYLMTVMPLGLLIYTLKSDLGINVFKKTGYHGFVNCLNEQIEKINEE